MTATAKRPPSPGHTKSCSSLASADASTTTAEPSPSGESDWRRIGANTLEHRDGYRIEKSHVRSQIDYSAPVYHAYAPGGRFIGVAGGTAEAAQALCAEHITRNPQP